MFQKEKMLQKMTVVHHQHGEPVAILATKPEVLVARDEMLVALATVLVAISSPVVPIYTPGC